VLVRDHFRYRAVNGRAVLIDLRGPGLGKRHHGDRRTTRRVPLGVLQKLMGHADITTTMQYVDVDDKRDAIAAVFEAFGQPAGNEPAGTRVTKALSVDEM